MAEEKKKITPEELAKILSDTSVVDLNSTMKILEKDYGISVQVPVAAVPAAPAGAPAPAQAEEKSVFNVVLAGVGDKKIDVIKVVRDVTQKGLKEAKDLVDASSSAPQLVKENVKKEEAEEMKKKFESAGAKVELR
ncbi:MAG: 50S ribosomal protein L7/L12 [Parcubacteria group bacterium Gr01-1014_30]|nr:MAG: 50S ribosomal protein L7/L12 [Parcubacteria group bacterium Gr01-1014_30]